MTENQSKSDTRTPGSRWDIASDLSWIELLKGIAIIGVIFDNWTSYLEFTTRPAIPHKLAVAASTAVGPWVQVFFILSGFGLTVGYLRNSETSWSWGRWAWRRITKIVLPYWVFVFVAFALGILGTWLYESIDLDFSWLDLLAYLTFTRNLFPETWAWNPPMWFMPVIIGLYVSFPVLLLILKQWGMWAILVVSGLITYGTIAAAVLSGASLSHGADHFTFWMLQFSLGMVLAWVKARSPQKLRYLIGPVAFALGLGLLVASWYLRTYIPLGAAFNDSVTSVGIFLILLNLVWALRTWIPGSAAILTALGRVSYYMFLVHYPLMRLFVHPRLKEPLNPLIVLALGIVFLILIYAISLLLSRPMNRLTSWVYHRIPASAWSEKGDRSNPTSQSTPGHGD